MKYVELQLCCASCLRACASGEVCGCSQGSSLFKMMTQRQRGRRRRLRSARLQISDLSAAGPCPKRKPQLETLLTTYCSTGCNANSNCMHCPLVYSWEPGWTCPGGLETAPKDVENQCAWSLRSSCHHGQQRANPRIARGSNFLYFLIVKRETSSVVCGDWSRGIIGRHWLH